MTFPTEFAIVPIFAVMAGMLDVVAGLCEAGMVFPSSAVCEAGASCVLVFLRPMGKGYRSLRRGLPTVKNTNGYPSCCMSKFNGNGHEGV